MEYFNDILLILGLIAANTIGVFLLISIFGAIVAVIIAFLGR
jgi:hypothetical protein